MSSYPHLTLQLVDLFSMLLLNLAQSLRNLFGCSVGGLFLGLCLLQRQQ